MHSTVTTLQLLVVLALSPEAHALFGSHDKGCTLNCRNGGLCQKVATEIHTGGDVHSAHDYAPARKYKCQCPQFYAGPECEIKFLECPNAPNQENDTPAALERQTGSTCENGAPCLRDVDETGITYYHCGCSTEETDYASPDARRTCQRMSTVFCLPDNKKAEAMHQSLGESGGAFCRNNGKCKKIEDSSSERVGGHPGCECPLEWTGPHCESPVDEALKAKFHMGESNTLHNTNDALQNEEDAMRTNFRLTVAWICLVVVVTMLGGIGFAVWDGMRETQRQKQRRRQKSSQIPQEISAKVRSRKTMGMEPMEIESF